MTVPACKKCNSGYSTDEMRAAAVISTVSFTAADIEAVKPGGWVHAAKEHDRSLKTFIDSRLREDGIFMPDKEAVEVLKRVSMKTATGLLFYEFGKIIKPDKMVLIALEHAKNLNPNAFVEMHRREDAGYAKVTPSGRELERQVKAMLGFEPGHMPKWKVQSKEFFEYMFIKRANRKMLCALKFHEAITVLLECPWPSDAGPRRVGKPRKQRKPA